MWRNYGDNYRLANTFQAFAKKYNNIKLVKVQKDTYAPWCEN
jgi:hypothetical protein